MVGGSIPPRRSRIHSENDDCSCWSALTFRAATAAAAAGTHLRTAHRWACAGRQPAAPVGLGISMLGAAPCVTCWLPCIRIPVCCVDQSPRRQMCFLPSPVLLHAYTKRTEPSAPGQGCGRGQGGRTGRWQTGPGCPSCPIPSGSAPWPAVDSSWTRTLLGKQVAGRWRVFPHAAAGPRRQVQLTVTVSKEQRAVRHAYSTVHCLPWVARASPYQTTGTCGHRGY